MLINGNEFNFDKMVYLMAVLNVTPDSFSDGGKYFSPENALEQGRRLIEEGADILDVGGESTRPGSEGVAEEEELRRVIPVIEMLAKESDVPISIDTTKANVAAKALASGASILNDTSGLRFDPAMISVAAQYHCPVCIMHMKGSPQTMQKSPFYEDVVTEVREFFEERIDEAQQGGIQKGDMILDPGIGFGKRLEDNLALINHLDHFKDLGCPLLVGTSRKSFIGKLLNEENPEQRLYGTLGSLAAAVFRGARILRVHDVKPARQMLAVMQAILENQTGKAGKIRER